jgi:PAS domain S-box-containing protein
MKFTPFRVTVIYFIFAVIWITTTDQILDWLISDANLLTQMQTAKGLFYISLTAIGLYLMMKSYEGFLSKSRDKLAAQEKSLNLALESAMMGVWEYNVETDSYVTSDNHHQMFGLEKDADMKLEDVYKRLHPDDYDQFKKMEYGTLLYGEKFNFQYRVVLNGSHKWLWTKGEPKTKNGKVVSVSGVTIDITESKRLQFELEREQELQKKIFENIPVMITIYRPSIFEFSVNSEFEKVTGWDNESIQGADLMREVYPDDEYREEVAEFMMNPGTGWKDFKMKVRNGSIIESSWTNVRLSDDTQIGIGIDITERKHLEESLAIEKERLEKLFDRIPVLINVFDSEQNLISVNRYHEEILGWTSEDISKKTLLELCYPDPEYREKVMADIRMLDEGWKEYDVMTKSGEVRKQLWTNLSLSDDTNVGIGYDITERKVLEDKIAAEREELQIIFDSMPVMINLHEQDPTKVSMNKYFESVIGYKNEEITQEEFLEQIIEEKDQELTRKIISESDGTWHDFNLLTKDGKKLKTTWTNIRISDSRSMGIGIDITERKEMEEKLRESEEWLSLTTGSAFIGKWEWNPQTGEVVVDEIWANLVGYSLEELQPISIKTWDNLVHPDDYPKFEQTVKEYFDGKTGIYECEVRMKHKDGRWVWVLDRGRAIEWDNEGKPVRMVGTHIDISDRKGYEESLAYQASLLSNVSDAVISIDSKYNILSWNNAAEQIYGWKKEEVLGKRVSGFLQTEYESDETNESVLNTLLNSGSWQGEIVQKSRNGSKINIFSSVTLIRDAEGNVSDIISVNRNITERKQYQKEIRLLANVYLMSNTALAVTNHKTNCLERVNNSYANLFGYPKEEMIGMDIHKLYPDDHRDDTNELVKRLEEKRHVTIETQLKRQNGSLFDALINLSLVKDDETGTLYRISTVQDISELKRIQKQLAHERLRFELAANNVSDVVWEWNPTEGELWWGEGIETVMGYRKEDYDGDLQFWHDHIFEDDRDRVVTSMKKAEESGAAAWEAEYRFLAADGSVRSVSDSAVLIRDEKGRLLRIIGAMVDITQMLEYQDALQKERNRFELIAKSSNDVLYDFNLVTGHIWWSEGWQTRFGYKAEDVGSNVDWWTKRAHPEDHARILDSVRTAMNDGSDFWVGRYRFLNGENEYRYVIDKGYFIKNEEGESVQLVGTISDVTTEIEARENLKASEEQYRLLFEQSPLPMYIYDPESLFIITANQSAIEKYGYSQKELQEMKIYELHPEADYKAVKKEIKSSLQKKTHRVRCLDSGEKIW